MGEEITILYKKDYDDQRKTTEVVAGLGTTLYIGESSTVNAQKISQFIMKMLDDPIIKCNVKESHGVSGKSF